MYEIIGKILYTLEKYEKKRLFAITRRNILYIIWFLVYFTWSISLVQPFFGSLGASFFFTLLLHGGSLAIAYFFGDFIFGLIEGIRPIETKREKDYLTPLFEEVYQDVKELYPDLPQIRLHIVDSLTVNAIAIGNRTIAVTQGAIETFDSEELKGIMAHEMSHIYYGDTKAIIFNTIGNGIFSICVFIVKAVLRMLDNISAKNESKGIQSAFGFIRAILEMSVFFMLFMGSLILSFNSRRNEFKADKFAYEAGYGGQLTEALYILQKMSLGQKVKLVHRLQASHPRISKRIAKLEALEDVA